MKKKGKRYSAELKAKEALEAVKAEEMLISRYAFLAVIEHNGRQEPLGWITVVAERLLLCLKCKNVC